MPREAAWARAARWASVRCAGVTAREGGGAYGVVGVAGERAVGVVAGAAGDAGDQVEQGGGDDRRVDVDAGEVERAAAGGLVEFRAGRRAAAGPAGGVPAVAEQHPVGGAGGGERRGPGRGPSSRDGGAGQVEAGEGEAGGGGVHMGVGERGGDQGAVEVDDLVDAVREGVGGALGADPGDLAAARRPSRSRRGRRGCGPRRRAAGRCWSASAGALTHGDSLAGGPPAPRTARAARRLHAGRARAQMRGGRASYGVDRTTVVRVETPARRADPRQQVLQLVRGGDPHLEDVVLVARDAVARLDLGDLGEPVRDVVGGAGVERLHRDERGQGQPDGLGVDDRGVAADDAALLQPAHPLVHGRRGQARGLAQVGVAHPPVLDEQLHDLPVQLLHGARTYSAPDLLGYLSGPGHARFVMWPGAAASRPGQTPPRHLRAACDEHHSPRDGLRDGLVITADDGAGSACCGRGRSALSAQPEGENPMQSLKRPGRTAPKRLQAVVEPEPEGVEPDASTTNSTRTTPSRCTG